MAAPDGSNITMWHNPKCSTSRAVLALIRAGGVEPGKREVMQRATS